MEADGHFLVVKGATPDATRHLHARSMEADDGAPLDAAVSAVEDALRALRRAAGVDAALDAAW